MRESKIRVFNRKLSIVILSIAMFICGLVYQQPKELVHAITSSDTTSYVSVGEIYDSTTGKFKEEEMTTLLRYVLNSSDLDVGEYDEYIPSTVTDTKGLSAQDMRGDSTTITGGKDIVVTFGGLKWQVTYLSKDKDGNDILTLWLATSKSSSRWGHSSMGSSFTDPTPSILYGASYIRSVINNGADTDGDGDYGANMYSDSYSTTDMTAYTPQDSNIFKAFSDTSETGLARFIVKPEKVTWQESSQNAKTQLGESYRYPNENWADYGVNSTSSEWYSSNDSSYDMTAHSYYSAWKNDFLWLPSLTETGYSDTKIGIWGTRTAQRANGSKCWLRSCRYNMANRAFYLYEEGDTSSAINVSSSYAVRPALHLNLNSAADSATPGEYITGGEISIESTAHEYDGVARTPVVAVSYNGNQLVENTDFKVSYKLNGVIVSEIKDVGEYEVIAKGIGAYKKSLKTTYTVTSRPLSNATIPNAVTMTYTGSNINQTLEIIDSELSATLVQGVDYELNYENNINVGTATITITGINNYSGSDSRTFEITTLDMTDNAITVDSLASQTYTGSAFTLIPVVKFGGVTLTKDTDFTLAYADNINKGTATITISGMGNFSGERDVTFEILSREISSGTLAIQSVTYTGYELTPITILSVNNITLIKDTDYTEVFSSNVNAGVGYVEISGINNYSGTIFKSFTISRRNLSDVIISDIDNQEYTGALLYPELNITYNGSTLEKEVDYISEYLSNTELGRATVVVTGIGNFVGNVTKTFEIIKQDISDDILTLANDTYAYTGEAVILEETLTVNGTILVVYEDYTLSIHKGSIAGDTVSIAIDSGTYYLVATGRGNYTGEIATSFTITSIDITNASIVLANDTLEYNGGEQIPSFQLKLGSIIVNSSNYEVRILKDSEEISPKSIGTYTIEVEGINSFFGKITTTYSIVAKDLSGAVISIVTNIYTYNGSEIKPDINNISLEGNSISLDNVDISYSNNIGASNTATITVTGKGNYTGSVSTYFTIKKAVLKNPLSFVIGGISSSNGAINLEYSGTTISPILSIVDTLNRELSSADYILEYKRNNEITTDFINIGNITIVVSPKLNVATGTTNISGVALGSITINPIVMSDAFVEITGTYEYNNEPITPNFKVYVDNTKTTEVPNSSYTYTLTNNTNAGQGNIIVTFSGNYEGSVYGTFDIAKRNISNVVFEYTIPTFTYDGTPKTIIWTARDSNGANLTDQYTYTYYNNTNAGEASIVFVAKNNYTGSFAKTFNISPADIAEFTIVDIEDQDYTGNPVRPSVVVKIDENTILSSDDYTVTYFNNVLIGSASVEVNGKGNYIGTITKTFNISSTSISNVNVASITSITYSAKELKPSPIITYNNKRLSANTDYTLEYANNINAGTATITITGIGNFYGTTTANFTISPADLSAISLPYLNAEYVYTGNAITEYYAYLGDIEISNPIVQAVDFDFSNNINVGTATITVLPKDNNYTGSKIVTFEITKATLNISMGSLTTDSFVYTGMAIQPLPSVVFNDTYLTKDNDYTLAYSTDTINVGTKTVTISAVGNGNFIGSFSIRYYITPKSIANITIEDISNIVYTRNELKPSIVAKDGSTTLISSTDYTLEYSNNVNVGIATIVVRGKGNYLNTTTATKTFEIVPATIDSINLLASTSTYDRNNVNISASSVKAGDISLYASEYMLEYYRDDAITTDFANAGEITVKVLSNSVNFTVEDLTTTYTITPAIISSVSLNKVETTYSSLEQHPIIQRVLSSNNLILSTSEYNIAYTRSSIATSDFINAGRILLTITSNSSNFKIVNDVTTVYEILPKSINDEDIAIRYYYVEYVDGEYEPIDIDGIEGYDYMTADQKYIAYLVHPELKFNTTITLNKGVDFDFVILNSTDTNIETSTGFIDIGEYRTTITAKGNYSGTITDVFKVNPQEFSPDNVSIIFNNGNNYAFTGNNIVLDLSQELTLIYTQEGKEPETIYLEGTAGIPDNASTYRLYNQQTLTYVVGGEEVTFTFEEGNYGYLNNTNVGTAMFFLEGANNFEGIIRVEFNITAVDFSAVGNDFDFTLQDTSNIIYSGREHKPTLATHSYASTELIENVDFIIEYADNINASTNAKVIITGINNYTGTKTLTFTIKQKELDKSTMLTPISDVYYNGSEQRPLIDLIYNSVTLVNNTDYTISYNAGADFINVNDIVITISAKEGSNYTGTITHTYKILPRELRSITLSATSGNYNRELHNISFIVRDYENIVVTQNSSNLDIKYYLLGDTNTLVTGDELINAGSYRIEVTGLNNYTGTISATYIINKIEIGIEMLTAISNQVYTMSEIEPTTTLTYLSKALTLDTDYSIVYSNNTDVGIARIVFTGLGNFKGEFTAYFNIVAKDINDIIFDNSISLTKEFTGNNALPLDSEFESILKFGGYTLILNQDFIVYSSDSCVNVGEYDLQLKGIGNYSGIITTKFNIVAKDISSSDIVVSGVVDKTYTGQDITQSNLIVINTLSSTQLYSGQDYTITYSNNKDVVWNEDTESASAIITISAKVGGNYTGTKNVFFKILAKSLSDGDIVIESIEPVAYTGFAHEPKPPVTFNSSELTESDIEYSWQNNLDYGVASVIITAKSGTNFKGEVIRQFEIGLTSMDDIEVSGFVNSYVYNGQSRLQDITLTCKNDTLEIGVDYDVRYSQDTINVGDVTLTITGKNNYSGTIVKTYRITPLTLNQSSIIIADIQAQDFTGEDITPSLSITYTTTPLVYAQDYTLEYSNNVNAGNNANVLITFMGNYSGTATKTFVISSKSISLEMISGLIPQVYTGNPIEPTFEMIYNGVNYLDENAFTLNYRNNTNVGTAYIDITGKGNFVGSITTTFEINAKTLTIDDVVLNLDDSYVYNGSQITPTFTLILLDNTLLNANNDYTYTYGTNINAGLGEVFLEFKGNYVGSIAKTFTIEQMDISSTSVIKQITQNINYSGNAELGVFSLTYLSNILDNDDYTYAYLRNSQETTDYISAGAITIRFTGKNNYKGTTDLVYNIVPKILNSEDISIGILSTDLIYAGYEICPEIIVSFGANILEKDVDYIVSYDNNINASNNAKIIITAKENSNYQGSKQLLFEIEKRTLNINFVEKIDVMSYTGSEITPDLDILYNSYALIKGLDYSVDYSNNINVGSASIIISGLGNFTGTINTTFDIDRCSLSDAIVSGIDQSYVFAFMEIKPTINVSINEKALVLGQDYKIDYSEDVINIGEKTITITGIGNYKNNKSITYTITPKNLADEDIIISGVVDKDYNLGTAITQNIVVNYNSKIVYSADSYTINYSNNINAGVATLTIIGKGNYTGTKIITFNILKLNTFATVVCADEIIYEGNPINLSILDSSVNGTISTVLRTYVAGENNYNWTFIPSDTINYNSYNGTIKLNAIALEVIELTFSGNYKKEYFAYDNFDTTNMEVNLKYNSGKIEKLASNKYSLSIANGTPLKINDKVLITYLADANITEYLDIEILPRVVVAQVSNNRIIANGEKQYLNITFDNANKSYPVAYSIVYNNIKENSSVDHILQAGQYNAIIESLDENYIIENSYIEFEVYLKSIKSSDNTILIESDNGFATNETFTYEAIADEAQALHNAGLSKFDDNYNLIALYKFNLSNPQNISIKLKPNISDLNKLAIYKLEGGKLVKLAYTIIDDLISINCNSVNDIYIFEKLDLPINNSSSNITLNTGYIVLIVMGAIALVLISVYLTIRIMNKKKSFVANTTVANTANTSVEKREEDENNDDDKYNKYEKNTYTFLKPKSSTSIYNPERQKPYQIPSQSSNKEINNINNAENKNIDIRKTDQNHSLSPYIIDDKKDDKQDDK